MTVRIVRKQDLAGTASHICNERYEERYETYRFLPLLRTKRRLPLRTSSWRLELKPFTDILASYTAVRLRLLTVATASAMA